ncbi:MAG: hypothetical protein AAF050_25640, partial [Cyanobacteria bacterium J06649_5]
MTRHFLSRIIPFIASLFAWMLISPSIARGSTAEANSLRQALGTNATSLSAAPAIHPKVPEKPEPMLSQSLPERLVAPTEIAQENDDTRIRINVTGTRTPRPTQITPANVTVIEADDIDQQRVFGLEDLIRYEPGISVQNN